MSRCGARRFLTFESVVAQFSLRGRGFGSRLHAGMSASSSPGQASHVKESFEVAWEACPSSLSPGAVRDVSVGSERRWTSEQHELRHRSGVTFSRPYGIRKRLSSLLPCLGSRHDASARRSRGVGWDPRAANALPRKSANHRELPPGRSAEHASDMASGDHVRRCDDRHPRGCQQQSDAIGIDVRQLGEELASVASAHPILRSPFDSENAEFVSRWIHMEPDLFPGRFSARRFCGSPARE